MSDQTGEIERLLEALRLSMQRFHDLSDICRETPWTGYELAGSFLRASGDRIERVLAGANYHDPADRTE